MGSRPTSRRGSLACSRRQGPRWTWCSRDPRPNSSARSRSRRSPDGPVHTALIAEGHALDHIKLARAAHAIVVAPATADFIARAANGNADELLTASSARRNRTGADRSGNERSDVGPRADAGQRRPSARDRLHAYSSRTPVHSPLAREADQGAFRNRRRSSPTSGVCSSRQGSLRGKHVVVTAGPTREPVDPVRFLSNRSSGKMGVAIAAAAWRRGADVQLVAGPLSIAPPAGPKVTFVETTEQMRDAVERAIAGADALIMAAAPADFRPAAPATQKIKKSNAPPSITLESTPDILASTIGARSDTTRHRGIRARNQLAARARPRKVGCPNNST